MTTSRRNASIALALVLALAVGVWTSKRCVSAFVLLGIKTAVCPDGNVRTQVQVHSPSITRGKGSYVTVCTHALFAVKGTLSTSTAAVPQARAALFLVSGPTETPLKSSEWKRDEGPCQSSEVDIPNVADGDYLLRVKVAAKTGEATLDVPLPLYAPSRIHVLTDRPLYEAGNTVRFRAVALRAADLSPLDERPGVFWVRAPDGEVLLEEKVAAGAWGVAAGTFPLDKAAESGTWRVGWSSGDDVGERTFEVRPFTLPRFRVEASPTKGFFRAGEKPAIRGTVTYASGAPVAKARVTFAWSAQGTWPPPRDFLSQLPKELLTDANGAFTVTAPALPADLRGQNSLRANLSATDSTGDQAAGHVVALLAEDAIAVSAVTELASGLVEGVNNRVFLRATTADGALLPGASLHIKRAWEDNDVGITAVADEDSVASFQMDPGPAVTVVIPPMPYRAPPRPALVTRQSLGDAMADDGETSLADRLTLDRAEKSLASCAQLTFDTLTHEFGIVIESDGRVLDVARRDDPVARCGAEVLKALRFELGRPRLLQATYFFNGTPLPRLSANIEGVFLDESVILDAFESSLLKGRSCLPPGAPSGLLPLQALFSHRPGDKEVRLSWVTAKNGTKALASVASCVASKVDRLALPKSQDAEACEEPSCARVSVGVATVSASLPADEEARRPQATTMLGYEYKVTARRGKELLGSTLLRVAPGRVPPIRLRLTPQIIEPGSTAQVEILRSADFTGALPEELTLYWSQTGDTQKVDPTERQARFQIPADAKGWANVSWGGATAYALIRPQAALSLTVTPDKASYRPGALAHLALETTADSKPVAAGVGLFGVDATLGQLAPLPTTNALSSLVRLPPASSPFLGLDVEALFMGRIRGKNAAAAVLMNVSGLPAMESADRVVALSGSTTFDPNAQLVDAFYVVLSELHAHVRLWEAGAGDKEKLTPKLVAKLWKEALEALEKKKQPHRDAFGRPLRLSWLAPDLLSLTAPRAVVVDATHLPEDNENWAAWVAKEKP